MELFVDQTDASLVLMVVIMHIDNGRNKSLAKVVTEATRANETIKTAE